MAKPLRIADNKHKFVALLDEACRRLDIDDEDRHSRLIALAVRCDLDKATLFRAVERDGPPALNTLRALSVKTQIPVTSWLLSLGALDADDIGRALARHSRPDLLDEKQLRALEIVTPLPDDVAFANLALWAMILALPRHDSAHAVSRTRAHQANART